MLEKIKKLIEQNEEVKESLQGCSDEFILKNSSLILKALSDTEVFEGYKMKLKVESDSLEWEYVPVSEEARKGDKVSKISNNYTYKLTNDQSNLYLIDLNQLEWTKGKAGAAKYFKDILENVRNNTKAKGIWLYGTHNTGKTFAMIALLNMIALEGRRVAYVQVNDLVLKTQEAMSSYETSFAKIIEDIIKAEVVVIDDLGVERSTPWFKENILLPILESRSQSEKLTLFSANMDVTAYSSRLKFRSQYPETEEATNDKIVAKIKNLITAEVKIG